jgi:hypothetical protein
MTRFDPRLSAHGPADLPHQPRPEPTRPDAQNDPLRARFSQGLDRLAPAPVNAIDGGSLAPSRLEAVNTVKREVGAGIAGGAQRCEVLAALVEQRLRQRLAAPPSAEFVQRVSEQLASDPNVSALYSRLAAALGRDSHP